MFEILPQSDQDSAAVEALLDISFGPDRFKKTAYRLREGVPPVDAMSFVAKKDGEVVGTIRFWPVVIKDESVQPARKRPALMLGPIAVEPSLKGQGIGIGLMQHGLAAAKGGGAKIVVLVGDLDYYSRVGFSRAPAAGLRMPGPVDPDRLLALELEPGALAGVAGPIGRARGSKHKTAVAPPKAPESRRSVRRALKRSVG
jgi:predicted N-acetyltransferase YhbS